MFETNHLKPDWVGFFRLFLMLLYCCLFVGGFVFVCKTLYKLLSSGPAERYVKQFKITHSAATM